MTDENPDPFEADLDGAPRGPGSDAAARQETFDDVLSRFSDEVRRGQRPSIDAYVRQYPGMADEIRELFPLLQTLEQWKSDKELECLRQSLPPEFPVRRLGHYELVREVGRGGMGVVFEAVHVQTQRRVAVKLLPWRFAAALPRWKERLRREAETIAALQHENIVPVYSFGECDGYSYYVMKLVEGISLDRLIQQLRETDAPVRLHDSRAAANARPPLSVLSPAPTPPTVQRDSWAAFARMGAQVALALHYAHGRDVVHYDVKPANLLIDETGRTVVTDFGIGHRGPHDGPEDDQPMGTLRYMSPERLLGQADLRSDIYSLGATLYEVLTRTPAFGAADRRQLIDAILHGEPPRPRHVVPQIPRPLEAIVLQAMARDPAGRYPSALALAADLLRYSKGRGVHAPQPGWLTRLAHWSRQHFRNGR